MVRPIGRKQATVIVFRQTGRNLAQGLPDS
jgi:hypothetical protein